MLIHGAGGVGQQQQSSAPEPRRPKITQDDPALKSISFAQLQVLLCEGDVEGPAYGNNIAGLERSVFLDDTPIRNAANQVSPQPEDLVFSWGRPHSQQSGVPSFNRVSETIGVDTVCRNGLPVAQGVTADVSGARYYARVLLTWQSLYAQTVDGEKTSGGDGDIRAWKVNYRVQSTDSAGTVRTHFNSYILGKFSSTFQKSHDFVLEGVGPDWTITATRLTKDDDTADPDIETRSSTFNFSSVVLSLDQKFSYANSSMLSVGVRADNYSAIPSVSIEMKGLKIEVPSNYNPTARTYSGIWDGTFKTAYSNNPAWVLRDLILADRYGLGQYIETDTVDKWSLYEIAQYCDAPVNAPNGGSEPRFICNVLLQSGEEAWNVLQQLSSVFRGLLYYASSMAVAVQDRDKDPVFTFSSANTIEQVSDDGQVSNGSFAYSGVARRARHTVVLASWDDPDNDYESRVEYVSDDESYQRHGYRPLDLRLLGVTSRGQALRAANWALISERLLDDTVTFSTNEIGSAIRPGDIVKIADSTKAAVRAGGRIASVSGNQITLDLAPTPPTDWSGATFSWMVSDADGNPEVKVANITAVSGNTVTINSNQGFPPVATFPWLVEFPNRTAQLFRILTVEEGQEGIFDLTALRYRKDIYDAVDFDTPLEEDENYLFKIIAPTIPTNVAAQVIWDNNTAKLEITWDPPKNQITLFDYDLTVREYRVQWQAGTLNDDNTITWSRAWRELPRQVDDIEYVTIDQLSVTDKFRTRICAVGRLGQQSDWSATVIADDIWVWFPMPDISVDPPVLNFYNQASGAQLFDWNFGQFSMPPYISGVRLECRPNRDLTDREKKGLRLPNADGWYIYGDFPLEEYAVCVFHADTNWQMRLSFNTFVIGLRGDSYARQVVDRLDLVPPPPNRFVVVTDTDKKSVAPIRRFSWTLPTSEIDDVNEDGDIVVTKNWPLGKVTDIDRFRVRYKAGFQNIWELGVDLFADGVPGDQRYFETHLFDGGTWTVMIRSVDKTGWISDNQAGIIVGFGDAIPSNVVETFCADPDWPGQKINMELLSGGFDWGNAMALCVDYSGVYIESDCINDLDVSICTDGPLYNSPPFQQGSANYNNADIQPRGEINDIPVALLQTDPTTDGEYFFAIDVTVDDAGLLISTISNGTYQWFVRRIGEDINNPMYPVPLSDPMYPEPQTDYMYLDTSNVIGVDFHPYVPFEKLPQGQYEVACRIRSVDSSRQTALASVCVELDYPDVVKTQEDVYVAAGTQRIYFAEPFPHRCKAVNLTLQDPVGSDLPATALLMGKDPSYFEMRGLDKDGQITPVYVDVTAVGY